MMIVDELDVKGKKVFLRASLDVPLDPTKDLLDPQRVTDDTRIKDMIPTLRYLVDQGAKVILQAGWCGRPKGVDPAFSMAPVAKRIEELLGTPVKIAPDCFKDKVPKSVNKNREEVKAIVDKMVPRQVVVFENVRYDPEANGNDPDFAKFMASLADVYVNEAEAQNHRPEATIVSTPIEIAKKGGQVAVGFKYADVLEKIGGLKKSLEDPERGPFVLGLCGKKIESNPGITSKISVARDLINQMKHGDTIITGGAVVYTFILAEHFSDEIQAKEYYVDEIVQRYDKEILVKTRMAKDKKEAEKITSALQKEKSEKLKVLLNINDDNIKALIGESYIRWGQEGEQIVFAYDVMMEAEKKGIAVITAYDHVVTDKLPDAKGDLPPDADIKVHPEAEEIPTGYLGVGEGPSTLDRISAAISSAAIYLQSGPYSIEDARVEEISGTNKVTFDAAKACKENGGIVIGAGGDTTARINSCGAHGSFTTISSAGGATLELIQTGTSKGKDALLEAERILGL